VTESILDRPEVLSVLFYPRHEEEWDRLPSGVLPIAIPVEPGIYAGGRLHTAGPEAPLILYFHGNGEIAADYDDLGPFYNGLGITLLVVDYRGYGASGGQPTASNLLADAVIVFERLGDVLAKHGVLPSQTYVMGRSLGSAAAIEVASRAGDRVAGLIVESGFADTFGLLRRLGLRVQGADEERDGFGNAAKMERIATPALVIHGQDDILIPPADGQELYRRSAAADKRLVLIPGAGHNDLMWVGREAYFKAVGAFVGGEPPAAP
jgi:pimeloyl-ACP methyl ester carboxylesterase